jgi:hypothetical protein
MQNHIVQTVLSVDSSNKLDSKIEEFFCKEVYITFISQFITQLLKIFQR